MLCHKCQNDLDPVDKFCPECGAAVVLAESLVAFGIEAYNEGEYKQAIQNYDEAIRLSPQDANTYSSRGMAYWHLGQYERAIQDYDEAIELNLQQAEVYYARGNITRKSLVYYARGIAYEGLGKTKEAELDFQKAKDLGYDPNDVSWAEGRLAGIIIALAVLGVIALMVVGAFVNR